LSVGACCGATCFATHVATSARFPRAIPARVEAGAPPLFGCTDSIGAPWARRRSPTPAGLALDLAPVLPLGDRLALLELPAPPREPALGRLPHQPLDLAAVEQQLAGTHGLVAPLVHRLLVGRDVHALEPHLPVPHPRIRLRERSAAPAERLDLRAGQHDPGLEPLEDLVVVKRPPVGDDG